MGKIPWRRLGVQESGFTLIETVVAVFLVGTVVTGSMAVIGATTKASARGEGNIQLMNLVRTQIEIIHHSEFEDDFADYPSIPDIPEGFTVTFTASDVGSSYSHSDGTPAPSVLQRIVVTATGDDGAELSIVFCKPRSP